MDDENPTRREFCARAGSTALAALRTAADGS
jgi:hypothetical protein